MKMVILTVKHHDGFVLWQSRYTDHELCLLILETERRYTTGSFKSCQKYGLKLGLYLSPADLYQIENQRALW
ncbi:alpha-L-fucosidase [Elizabethkingia anophelis]|uniref:alpha-L-fucosidase n=1 Tax=Elizabethkingia anophelis TaxID=1117645 RepID=UPI001EEFEBBB|nr:alpha-L-fucosidase [Elizabethkingia anophelis]